MSLWLAYEHYKAHLEAEAYVEVFVEAEYFILAMLESQR